MSHAVAVLLTFIATVIMIAKLESIVKREHAKAGYIIVDTTAYRLVPVQ